MMWLRNLTKIYPFMNGAAWFNRRLDRFHPEPQWVVAPPFGLCPTLEFDLSQRVQRKTFFFPLAYGNYYLRSPLARLIAQRLSPGGVFLDIGANVGMFSLLAAERVGPSGEVLAFEPHPRHCESIGRSAARNGYTQLVAHPLALSDHEGQAEFFVDPNGLMSSLVPSGGLTFNVRVTSLDALRLDLPRLDLVKIDVEGEEPRTVAGCLETLVRFGKPPVWCEVRGPRGSRRAPDTLTPVCATLAQLGYAPFKFDGGPNGDVRPLTEKDIQRRRSQDILFEAHGGGCDAGTP